MRIKGTLLRLRGGPNLMNTFPIFFRLLGKELRSID